MFGDGFRSGERPEVGGAFGDTSDTVPPGLRYLVLAGDRNTLRESVGVDVHGGPIPVSPGLHSRLERSVVSYTLEDVIGKPRRTTGLAPARHRITPPSVGQPLAKSEVPHLLNWVPSSPTTAATLNQQFGLVSPDCWLRFECRFIS